MTATGREVAHAQAAVVAGMDVAMACHEAAGRTPGQGALVALPVPASGAATGEGYNVPASTPAIRPQVRPAVQPQYADLTVGGIGPGGYHGSGSALEGVPVPGYRSSTIAYVPASGPRQSLGDRLRGVLRALRRR